MISPSHPRPCARLHVSGRAATSRPNPVRHTRLDKRLLHWWPPLGRPQARAHSSRPRRPLPARRQQGLLLCPSSWAPLTPSAAPARGAGIPPASPQVPNPSQLLAAAGRVRTASPLLFVTVLCFSLGRKQSQNPNKAKPWAQYTDGGCQGLRGGGCSGREATLCDT